MEIPDFLIKQESAIDITFLPEDDDGYIEYKLRLDTKGSMGLKKLYSQMNWRLEEGQQMLGNREAHYLLGVKDNGELGGLTEEEIQITFEIFAGVVKKCDADVTHTINKTYERGSIIYAVISKKEKKKIRELNVAFVGPCQHGKTTTISNLVYGRVDNGSGYSRSLIFKHAHEKETGQTSSVKKEILGIKGNKIINYSSGMRGQWEDIVCMSDKIVNLIDLPGCSRFLRTTLFGLESYDLDAICIVVDKLKMTEEDNMIIEMYVNYAKCLNIRYTMVWVDECSETMMISSEQERGENEIFASNKIAGGLKNLEQFLCVVTDNVKYTTENTPVLFSVIEKYFIQDSGIVFSGILKYGNLELGQTVYLTNGNDYISTTVKSIHKKQIDSQVLFQKETGAIKLNIGNVETFDTNKYVLITDKHYDLLHEVTFKVLWSSLSDSCDIKLACQRALLFVDNNVIQVLPEILENDDKINLTFLLKFETLSIIPVLAHKSNVVCFLKNAHGVFIGMI
jgi:GTPase